METEQTYRPSGTKVPIPFHKGSYYSLREAVLAYKAPDIGFSSAMTRSLFSSDWLIEGDLANKFDSVILSHLIQAARSEPVQKSLRLGELTKDQFFPAASGPEYLEICSILGSGACIGSNDRACY
jgi:hypothetical protein